MSSSASISPLFDPPEPTTEQTLNLLKEIEKKFPSATLGTDKWYLVALAALTYIEPTHASILYSYLISQPEYSTPASRQFLIRRLRECLMQQTSILGVCKPLEALISIIKVEAPSDRDTSFSRQDWQAGPQNLANGDAWLKKVYKENIDDIDKIFESHKDFLFVNHQITYGFYLSDMSILGEIETELSVFSGIAVQNLPLETRWHLRGLRRVGVSSQDVEVVQCCVEMVAEYGGRGLGRLPRVGDIEDEV